MCIVTSAPRPVKPAKVRKPRPRLARSIRLVAMPRDGGEGIVEITEGTKVDRYLVKRLGSDFGTAFQMEKVIDPDGGPVSDSVTQPYQVNLNGTQSTCECLGFARWSHCRHVHGLQALVDAEKL